MMANFDWRGLAIAAAMLGTSAVTIGVGFGWRAAVGAFGVLILYVFARWTTDD